MEGRRAEGVHTDWQLARLRLAPQSKGPWQGHGSSKGSEEKGERGRHTAGLHPAAGPAGKLHASVQHAHQASTTSTPGSETLAEAYVSAAQAMPAGSPAGVKLPLSSIRQELR